MYEGIIKDIHYYSNIQIDEYNNQYNLPILICIHGNSSCADIFIEIIKKFNNKFNILALDLPGCGNSYDLDSYTMDFVGDKVSDFISTISFNKLYFFGHSLGGHLLPFIKTYKNQIIKGIILAGTPPLSSINDFKYAFTPNPEYNNIIKLLSKNVKFTENEAKEFINYLGYNSEIYDLLVRKAIRTDGKFREGCLLTLCNKNQIKWLSKYENTFILHFINDGIINSDYLENIPKKYLYKGKIHYMKGKHMTPILNSDELASMLLEYMDND
jgi:pimeloyl-ACP methyl ester carboxylesterase